MKIRVFCSIFSALFLSDGRGRGLQSNLRAINKFALDKL